MCLMTKTSLHFLIFVFHICISQCELNIDYNYMYYIYFYAWDIEVREVIYGKASRTN